MIERQRRKKQSDRERKQRALMETKERVRVNSFLFRVSSTVFSAIFTQDGSHIVSSSQDSTVKVWSAILPECQWTCERTLSDSDRYDILNVREFY